MTALPRKLKVAILLSSSEEEGGAFVQSLNIARLLRPSTDAPYTADFIAIDKSDRARLVAAGLPVAASTINSAKHVLDALNYFPKLRARLRHLYLLFNRGGGWFDKFAEANGYDVLVFTSNSRLVMGVKRTPFVYNIWDVCHLDHPEFPEYTADDSFTWRETLYKSVLPRASGYIADTDALADRMALAYGLDRSKAIIIPYQVSEDLLKASVTAEDIAALRHKYALDKPFIFYPAQFWPHKNHAYILRALEVLRERGVEMNAVFSGADRGTMRRIKELVTDRKLEARVKFVGFLPTEDVARMYRAAVAAVMPSYFGPTNIPPLEAQAMGCQFIYADLPGYREFAGPDCFYCDLTRPEHLADQIEAAAAAPARIPNYSPVNPDLVAARINRFFDVIAAKIAAWS
jgi:glycosyltransferase involved in cell wall biosynthesis